MVFCFFFESNEIRKQELINFNSQVLTRKNFNTEAEAQRYIFSLKAWLQRFVSQKPLLQDVTVLEILANYLLRNGEKAGDLYLPGEIFVVSLPRLSLDDIRSILSCLGFELPDTFATRIRWKRFSPTLLKQILATLVPLRKQLKKEMVI